MPTTNEILEWAIENITEQTAKLKAGFKEMQTEMQTGFTKVQAQINSLNNTFQRNLSLLIKAQAELNNSINTFQRNLPLLMFESIQEITKAVEESTFDWNVWTPSQESSLLSLGTFLSRYGCKVEGYDDIVIRQIFSSTFPRGLCQIDNKVMAGVLLASDVYTERKPEAPMQPRKRGRTSYLQSVDGKVKESLVSFNEPEQEFPKTTEYGTTTLKRILENITKKDTEWDPSRLTRLECSQRVRLYYLDSILSVLLMIEGRFLSIRDEISLEAGMVAKFDMLVMERDTNYYVIEVKEYPLFDEEQISTDLSKLLYQDFPQKTQKLILQLIESEIYSKCGRGVLTDSFYYIFVEFEFFNERRFRNGAKHKYQWPFKYYVSSCRSNTPYTVEILFQLIQQAIRHPYHIKLEYLLSIIPKPYCPQITERISRKRIEEESETLTTKKVHFDFQNDANTRKPGDHRVKFRTRSRTSLIDPNLSLALLLNPSKLIPLSIPIIFPKICVYQTRAYFLREVIGDLFSDEEELVVKVFLRDKKKYFYNERRVVELLSKDPEFNNGYISHKYGLARIIGKPKYIGPFLIHRYIKETEYFPKSKCKEIEKQAKVMFNNGIVYTSMKKKNILYNEEEDKIYFIDFEEVMFRLENDAITFEQMFTDCIKNIEQICKENTKRELHPSE